MILEKGKKKIPMSQNVSCERRYMSTIEIFVTLYEQCGLDQGSRNLINCYLFIKWQIIEDLNYLSA